MLPLPCGMLISILRVEISIPQGKGLGMFDYHVVLQLQVKLPVFRKPQVGTVPPSNIGLYVLLYVLPKVYCASLRTYTQLIRCIKRPVENLQPSRLSYSSSNKKKSTKRLKLHLFHSNTAASVHTAARIIYVG